MTNPQHKILLYYKAYRAMENYAHLLNLQKKKFNGLCLWNRIDWITICVFPIL